MTGREFRDFIRRQSPSTSELQALDGLSEEDALDVRARFDFGDGEGDPSLSPIQELVFAFEPEGKSVSYVNFYSPEETSRGILFARIEQDELLARDGTVIFRIRSSGEEIKAAATEGQFLDALAALFKDIQDNARADHDPTDAELAEAATAYASIASGERRFWAHLLGVS